MKKRLGIMAVALLLSACGGQPASEQTVTNTEPVTVASSEYETSYSQEAVSKTSENSLANYLRNHENSETYRLLYDIALNENANTISDSDKGITYMFSEDDNGNRIPGTVMAHYSDLDNADTSGKEEFCKSFVDSVLPELSSLWDKAETYSEGEYFGIILSFDDYSITLMPDNSLDGMSVILSKNE